MENFKVIVTRDDELFHSDTFLGDEFDDEMYHWKYVKKKKVNGKWRYYYDVKDAMGVDELKTYNKAKDVYETAERNRIESKRAVRDFENKSRNYSYKEYDYDKSHDLYRSAIYWKETSVKRGQEYLSARSSVLKTPVAGIVVMKETIDKGKRAINNLLNKLKKKK